MWELMSKGGPVMFGLLGCSVVGVYIIIYKIIFLRAHYVRHNVAANYVKEKLLSDGKEETFKALRSKQKIMLRVLASAVKLSDQPRDEIQDGIKEATYPELPKLEQHLALLSSIITVAPILGLMGTVLGLMDIFNVISGGGLGDTQALSSGIAEALITTVSGLGIAIPFIFCYQHLAQKVDVFILEMEHLIYDIVTFCKANSAIKN